MKALLKMKAWQVFSILFVVPIIIQVALIQVSAFIANNNVLIYMLLLTALLQSLFLYLWLFTMGAGLINALKNSIPAKTKLFTFNMYYVPTYCVFFFIHMALAFMNITSPYVFFVLIPGIILAACGMLYVCYFISKCLLVAESHTNPDKNDIRRLFILLLILPIGIWIIQKRINKVFEDM